MSVITSKNQLAEKELILGVTGSIAAYKSVYLLRELTRLGANVTAPHKQAAIPLVDELGNEVRALGALNTIVNVNGRLVASNTDAAGLARWMRLSGIDPAGHPAVVIGAVIYHLRLPLADLSITLAVLWLVSVMAMEWMTPKPLSYYFIAAAVAPAILVGGWLHGQATWRRRGSAKKLMAASERLEPPSPG